MLREFSGGEHVCRVNESILDCFIVSDTTSLQRRPLEAQKLFAVPFGRIDDTQNADSVRSDDCFRFEIPLL